MRNLLQYLLILFALALCGLIAFQWHREAALQQEVHSLSDQLQRQRTTAVTLSNSVKQADAEISRLQGLTSQFDDANKATLNEIGRLNDALKTHATNPAEVDAYKKALETANARIAKQNDDLKKLADDHNNAVLQFNKLTEDYNELVKKWNAQQEQLSKPAPSAAPDK